MQSSEQLPVKYYGLSYNLKKKNPKYSNSSYRADYSTANDLSLYIHAISKCTHHLNLFLK